jgi:hypothetical protein
MLKTGKGRQRNRYQPFPDIPPATPAVGWVSLADVKVVI